MSSTNVSSQSDTGSAPPRSFGVMWNRLPNELKIAILKHASLKTLKDLLHFRGLRHLARRALRERVNDVIEAFHLEPSLVLDMMQNTGTILSGSAALYVVAPSLSWTPGDLDFYTPFGQADTVVNFFTTHSYQVAQTYPAPYTYKKFFTHSPGNSPPSHFEARFRSNSCIEKVYTLVHAPSTLTINVIQSRSPASAAPLAFFHSTLVMNYISGGGVVWMMNFQTMPPIQHVHSRDIRAICKYQDRGYLFVQGDDHDITVDGNERERSWDDPWTLRMRFQRHTKVVTRPNSTIGWRTSFREFYNWGFREHAPQVLVEEGNRLVCYRNWVGPAYLTMSSRPSRARRIG